MSRTSRTSRILVLGGGGVTGIAWELGILAGLRDAGVDLTDADTVVGTSAGSVVGTQITSGTPLETLYARQLRSAEGEVTAKLPLSMLARWIWALTTERDLRRARARIGRLGHAHSVSSLEERRRTISARLPTTEWPDADLWITAVDAHTGERRVFDRGSGVPLVDAVMASCAVPGVWPPALVNGRPHIDGGLHSSCNADLAAGYERVVVLSPTTRTAGPLPSAADDLARIDARTTLITPDDPAQSQMGRNPLDPAFRAAAARAGRAQAPAIAKSVAETWTGD
ncbi:patatin-like phospholipase family protein [Streptomonospora nanhaiensis]|uniref:patatin-like phospholipase family protein n=1 Tax=Streptomonospora nanhaiensis TaxID=1323731 RepID=UPI001C99A373|nr:patatin-like phospholipase family protein [Streptomonospora nanhaiensis]MBX9387023.1 patatin-like phospholipase family protein [Streptomonospora nanhaiensis]